MNIATLPAPQARERAPSAARLPAAGEPAPGRSRWRLSVRTLAAFVHRHGDLGRAAEGPGATAEEGIVCQARWQARQPQPYRREVAVRGAWQSAAGLRLALEGRMDGCCGASDTPCIDEIKTYRGDLEQVRTRAGRLHEAQAVLYAALHARAHDLTACRVRLIYLDADDGRATLLEHHWSRARLDAFLDDSCQRLAQWLAPLARRRQRRNQGLQSLGFPKAEFRSQQRQLARLVWRTLDQRTLALASAPTGIGKSLATLYGALRRLPGTDFQRLLYTTAQRSGRASAWQAMEELTAGGLPLSVVDLAARNRLCLQLDTPCHGEACPYARGYYDRHREALAELLGLAGDGAAMCSVERAREVGKRHRVCPVQLQREAARWSDVVITDFNQIFDPLSRQAALLDDTEGGAALLVDEAHNLEPRLRAMYSAALDRGALERLHAEVRGLGVSWSPTLQKLTRLLADPQGRTDPERQLRTVGDQVESLAAQLDEWFGQQPQGGGLIGRTQALRQSLARWLQAWRAWQTAPADFHLQENEAERELQLECLNARHPFAAEREWWQGTVLFSATLPPAAHLQHTLGLPQTTTLLQLPGAFDPRNRRTLLVTDLDLRAQHRTHRLPDLAALLEQLTDARAGHYLVFVPAHGFLRQLAAHLQRYQPDAEVLVQSPAMSAADIEHCLQRLRAPDGRTRILLAVSGGVFAEGVDLVGEALVGVVIAGLPMPAPDLARLALQARHGAAGFDVAFRTPALERVRQAAGRLIRSPSDRGVLCLVDPRLQHAAYRHQLPSDWAPELCSWRSAGSRAAHFWSRAAQADKDRTQPSSSAVGGR